MSKRTISALTLVAIFAVCGLVAIALSRADTAQPDGGPTKRLVVKYKQEVDSQPLSGRIERIRDAEEVAETEPLRLKVVEVPEVEAEDTRQRLQADPAVEYAEEDQPRYRDALTPNDPQYRSQWYWSKIGADTVWEKTTGSSNVILAVIDSGLDASFAEVGGRTVSPYNFDGDNTDIKDEEGHGTEVTAAIAASGNDGVGMAGACWKCRVMPLKSDGSGSSIVRAVQHAVDNGAKAINISMSGTSSMQSEADAIAYAIGKGVIIFSSAGNDSSTNKRYPTSYPGVISVAATNQQDQLADFSNRERSVELAAPGEGILLPDTLGGGPGTYYQGNGTSFSTPIAVGVAGLLFSAFPQATAAQVTDAMTKTADACCNSAITGGRLNALKAYNQLAALFPTTTPPTPPPTPPVTPPTTPPPTPPTTGRPADINADGKVNVSDLSIMLTRWKTADAKADLNANGVVDLPDLSILLTRWQP